MMKILGETCVLSEECLKTEYQIIYMNNEQGFQSNLAPSKRRYIRVSSSPPTVPASKDIGSSNAVIGDGIRPVILVSTPPLRSGVNVLAFPDPGRESPAAVSTTSVDKSTQT